jgi:hypothetical protein
MKFLVTGRGEGKTTKLIEWMKAASDGEVRILVSHSLREVNRLQRENPDMASWQFVGVDDVRAPGFLAGLPRYERITVAIDNLDLVLQGLLHSQYPITVVAATGEPYTAKGDARG